MTTKSNSVVTAGQDGTYQFESLAPDDYLMSVILGETPIAGVAMAGGTLIHIDQSGTATCDIEVGPDPVLITVTATLPNGQPPRMSEIDLLPATLPSNTTAGAVHSAINALTTGTTGFKIEILGQPAKWKMPPGSYTLCVVPYPSFVAGMDRDSVGGFVQSTSEVLPAFCNPIVVETAPSQVFAISVLEPPAKGVEGTTGTGVGKTAQAGSQ
jgi:hypothetical protein